MTSRHEERSTNSVGCDFISEWAEATEEKEALGYLEAGTVVVPAQVRLRRDPHQRRLELIRIRLPGWTREGEERLAAAASKPYSHPYSTGRASHSTSHNVHAKSSTQAREGEVDVGPWPAHPRSILRAGLVHVPRRVRAHPRPATLPPSLSFPAPPSNAHSKSTSSTPNLTSSCGLARVCAPGIHHSPSQSDPSYRSHRVLRILQLDLDVRVRRLGDAQEKVVAARRRTSDAGWGSMLRMSQSLLATALQRVGGPGAELGTLEACEGGSVGFAPPDLERLNATTSHSPPPRSSYQRCLDAPAAPFGVHRMALAGKAARKDVGVWFGPSAAAGALRTLVDAYPVCGLGVTIATDGTLYQTEVFAASHSPAALAAHSRASFAPSSSRGNGARSDAHGVGARWRADAERGRARVAHGGLSARVPPPFLFLVIEYGPSHLFSFELFLLHSVLRYARHRPSYIFRFPLLSFRATISSPCVPHYYLLISYSCVPFTSLILSRFFGCIYLPTSHAPSSRYPALYIYSSSPSCNSNLSV
ncbi:hypothetical protein B0H17DRAFT_1339095 [Mycena rosella]|uniref:Cysteine protease n=1 Tax=Mycena rosella TaxID=1033263 RepID=A0AAD7CCV4_MYCRO|nr:hypothetical protein B0H17DRAFT_1339095 [Mycena rosella]